MSLSPLKPNKSLKLYDVHVSIIIIIIWMIEVVRPNRPLVIYVLLPQWQSDFLFVHRDIAPRGSQRFRVPNGILQFHESFLVLISLHENPRHFDSCESLSLSHRNIFILGKKDSVTLNHSSDP